MFQVCVLLFILFLAFWWASQGAFNALVHLVAVVLAGAFTFAFWELLVLGFTINRMPHYAWGVSFLAVFVIALLIVRKILDFTIKKNLYFGQIPNLLGGGVFGGLIGILTAGMCIIGIAYLPLEEELMGYRPLAIVEKPQPPAPPFPLFQPVRNEALWIPADDWTARFFTHLSSAAFYSGDSLAINRPDLFAQAHTFRLKDDGSSSPVTRPTSAEVVEVAMPGGGASLSIPAQLALALGAVGGQIPGRICCVNTKWNSAASGTYDSDGLVRIFPSQVRLGVVETTFAEPDEAHLIAPAGFSVIDPARKPRSRVFVPYLNDRTVTAGSGESDFTFVFVIPENTKPLYISFRGTRFSLPAEEAFKSDAPSVTAAIGAYAAPPVQAVVVGPPKPDGTFESNLSGSALIGGLEPNPNLPEAIDRNMVQGEFNYLNDTDILSGNSTVRKPFEGRVDRKVRTEKLAQPAGTFILRAQFEPTRAASLLGSAVAAAASLEAIYIVDSNGTQYLPIGYAWWKSTGETQIKVDREALIRSAREVPFREVNAAADRIYLYWQVPRGTTIKGLNVGSKTHYDLNVALPP